MNSLKEPKKAQKKESGTLSDNLQVADNKSDSTKQVNNSLAQNSNVIQLEDKQFDEKRYINLEFKDLQETIFTQHAKQVSDAYKVPFKLAFNSLIATLSIASNGKFQFNYKDTEVKNSNLYMVDIAPTGVGKSHLRKEFYGPIFEYMVEENERRSKLYRENQIKIKRLDYEYDRLEKDYLKEHNSENLSNLLERMSYNREQKEKYEKESQKLTVIMTDGTPEGVMNHLSKNDGILSIVDDEARYMMRILSDPHERHVGGLLTMYDGGTIDNQTKRDDLKDYVPNARLCYYTSIQPSLIPTWDKYTERGLLQRFLFTLVDEIQIRDEFHEYQFNQQTKNEYNNLIKALLMLKEPITLTAHGQELNQIKTIINEDINNQQFELSERSFMNISSKLRENSLRLLPIVHILLNPSTCATNTVIDSRTIFYWKRIVRYYKSQAILVFNQIGEQKVNTDIEYLFERVNKAIEQGKELTVRNIHQMCRRKNGFTTKKEFNNKLTAAVEKNVLIIVKQNNKEYINLVTE